MQVGQPHQTREDAHSADQNTLDSGTLRVTVTDESKVIRRLDSRQTPASIS